MLLFKFALNHGTDLLVLVVYWRMRPAIPALLEYFIVAYRFSVHALVALALSDDLLAGFLEGIRLVRSEGVAPYDLVRLAHHWQ